jgi:hypothetical protein
MSNGNGHHWSKFCWADWSADKALHPCSLAAKGFWIEMLCIMHCGTPVGHLTLGGKPATVRQMAANAYCTEKEARRYLAELEEAGVFSRTQDGTIYSRRMVKDAAASEAGREHIAKRWNGAKPPDPPNRVPNRGPTSQPNREPNRQANSHPSRDPIFPPDPPYQESEEDREEEEESKFNYLPSSSTVLARVAAACETPPRGTFGGEPDEEPGSNALQIEAKNIVGKLARKLESSGKTPTGKRPQLTVVEQIDAVRHGEIIEDDRPDGWMPRRPGPLPPQRTVAEQLAALGHPQVLEHAP